MGEWGVDMTDWKLLSPWLLLWIESFHPSRLFTAEQDSFSHCTTTTSYLKCLIIRLHCSMIFYLKHGSLRLWNFSFLLLWRPCYNKHIFHFSLHCQFRISLYENFRKIQFYFPTESSIHSAAENMSALWQHFICSYALFNCSGDGH